MKSIISFIFLLLTIISFGQEKKMKTISGYVSDITSKNGIEGVKVYDKKSSGLSYTDSLGFYFIEIRKGPNSLFYSHHKYESIAIGLKPNKKPLDVAMKPLNSPALLDSSDQPTLKNMIVIFPLNFIFGAMQMRYDRFIKAKHSLGLSGVWYYAGRYPFNSTRFTGFKIGPSYRYYPIRDNNFGIYIQASALLAHFDMSELRYSYDNLIMDVEDSFWTGGLGAAFGFTKNVGLTGHTIIDLSVGFQVLPLLVPNTIHNSNYGYEYSAHDDWWYFGGPGSVFEFKFSIGGIF